MTLALLVIVIVNTFLCAYLICCENKWKVRR